jgi:hypothetical protein
LKHLLVLSVIKTNIHLFVAGGDLATVIQNNLPRECAVLPSNDPLLLSGDAPKIVHVTSLELLEPHLQFKEILTLYDTLEAGCRFATIITLAAYLSPVFANKVRNDWSKNHQVTFIPYSSPHLTLSETHLWFIGHYLLFPMKSANHFQNKVFLMTRLRKMMTMILMIEVM